MYMYLYIIECYLMAYLINSNGVSPQQPQQHTWRRGS